MNTTLREPRLDSPTYTSEKSWRMATIVFAIMSAVFGFMLFEQQNSGHMSMNHAIAPGADYDLRFIDMMIPHHQQAIDEARNALKQAKHEDLRQLAHNIIQLQQAEIEKMKEWRRVWSAEHSPRIR